VARSGSTSTPSRARAAEAETAGRLSPMPPRPRHSSPRRPPRGRRRHPRWRDDKGDLPAPPDVAPLDDAAHDAPAARARRRGARHRLTDGRTEPRNGDLAQADAHDPTAAPSPDPAQQRATGAAVTAERPRSNAPIPFVERQPRWPPVTVVVAEHLTLAGRSRCRTAGWVISRSDGVAGGWRHRGSGAGDV
jgi:hypothetical protein